MTRWNQEKHRSEVPDRLNPDDELMWDLKFVVEDDSTSFFRREY